MGRIKGLAKPLQICVGLRLLLLIGHQAIAHPAISSKKSKQRPCLLFVWAKELGEKWMTRCVENIVLCCWVTSGKSGDKLDKMGEKREIYNEEKNGNKVDEGARPRHELEV